MTGISLDTVRDGLLFLIALILSISVHEFGHAWMANRLGDRLPASQGRLTLNPLRHIDPMGTIVFPMIAFFTHLPFLGWGRPVETNTLAYTRRFTRRGGHALVAFAGPAMNLVMAGAVSVLLILTSRLGLVEADLFRQVVDKLVVLNLFLMFFNLLPIPPLDGGAILAWLLPPSLQHVTDFLARWGFMILLGLLMVGGLRVVMRPALYVIGWWVRGLGALA